MNTVKVIALVTTSTEHQIFGSSFATTGTAFTLKGMQMTSSIVPLAMVYGANDVMVAVHGANDVMIAVLGANDVIIYVHGANDVIIYVLGANDVIAAVVGASVDGATDVIIYVLSAHDVMIAVLGTTANDVIKYVLGAIVVSANDVISSLQRWVKEKETCSLLLSHMILGSKVDRKSERAGMEAHSISPFCHLTKHVVGV